MWHPKTAQELEDAITNGVLPHKATSIDYKKHPPVVAAKNADMAIDVGAMSTDGGVLVYGVLEDRAAKTFSSSPFNLVGFKERISQVVDTHVREHIEFAVYELQLDTDPTQGFAAVVVPASLRAPHMVEPKGQYYGRQPGGDPSWAKPKSHVFTSAAAGSRRRRLRLSTHPLLWLPSCPRRAVQISISWSCRWSLIPAFASRAMAGRGDPLLVQDVHAASQALRFQDEWSPSFGGIIDQCFPSVTLDGIALLNPPVETREETVVNTYVAVSSCSTTERCATSRPRSLTTGVMVSSFCVTTLSRRSPPSFA